MYDKGTLDREGSSYLFLVEVPRGCGLLPNKIQRRDTKVVSIRSVTDGHRYSVQTAEGNWVNVNWNGDQLNFNNWNGNANDNIGSLSARHFLLYSLKNCAGGRWTISPI